MLPYILTALVLQPAATAIGCQQGQTDRTSKQITIEELTVTIAPSPKPEDVEDGCTVAVRDRRGREVFQFTGFNTKLLDLNGRDIDNDGHPDIVIETDSGGGNRCCFEFAIISPAPRPHIAAKLQPASFESDDRRQTVIWTAVAFYDLGPDMADSPTVEVAQQFRKGRLTDITSEYCSAMLANQARGYADMHEVFDRLTSAHKRASQQSSGSPSSEVQQTRVAAVSLALQALYCGRDDVAASVVRDVWPASEQAGARATIKKAAGSHWPAIGQRLANWK